jgi:hypothetical protein
MNYPENGNWTLMNTDQNNTTETPGTLRNIFDTDKSGWENGRSMIRHLSYHASS